MSCATLVAKNAANEFGRSYRCCVYKILNVDGKIKPSFLIAANLKYFELISVNIHQSLIIFQLITTVTYLNIMLSSCFDQVWNLY